MDNIMKYFKDNNGNVFAYDDTQLGLVGDKVELTAQELEAHINPPKTQEELYAEAVAHFEYVTTQYIESKVQEYNTLNGLAFKDIDAFTKYAINQASAHYTIANQFIAYADRVWAEVRAWQGTLTAIPTDAEWQAVVDGVAF